MSRQESLSDGISESSIYGDRLSSLNDGASHSNPIVNSTFNLDDSAHARVKSELASSLVSEVAPAQLDNPHEYTRHSPKNTRDPWSSHGSTINMEEVVLCRILPCVAVVVGSVLLSREVFAQADFREGSKNDPTKTIRLKDQEFLIAGALCGGFSCLVVLYQYLTRPEMRVYPNPLLIRQVLADTVLAGVGIVMYMPINDGLMEITKRTLYATVGAVSWSILIYLREWTWLLGTGAFSGFLVWLRLQTYDEGTMRGISSTCMVPSAVFMVALHASVWRLPLISVDLYRTMVNPFLEFEKSMREYDIGLCLYLALVFALFVGVEFDGYLKGGSGHVLRSDECPILRSPHDDGKCFSMAAAWSFGDEGEGGEGNEVLQPKICFVPNRSADPQSLYDAAEQQLLWVYPILWIYLPLTISTMATLLFSWLAYRRLTGGTSRSIVARLRIIVVNFRNIFSQIAWILVMAIFNTLTYAQPEGAYQTIWPRAFVFVVFARGWFDLACWFWVNFDNKHNETRSRQRLSRFSRPSLRVAKSTGSLRLSPGVNVALQKEMTGYLSRGLQRSAAKVAMDDPDLVRGFRVIALQDPNEDPDLLKLDPKRFLRLVFGIKGGGGGAGSAQETASPPFVDSSSATAAATSSSAAAASRRGNRLSTTFSDPLLQLFTGVRNSNGPSGGVQRRRFATGKDQGPVMIEYLPDVFRSIRATYGIAESSFREGWGSRLELKVNDGGASQAFFFFSSDKRFIVKSTTVEEMDLLRGIGAEYAHHLSLWPESFMVRIYGAYNLVVYGTQFRFYAMENLFYERKEGLPLVIHEKYDIKGSWVARNFAAPKGGESSLCRLCGEKYVVGEKRNKCSAHAQGSHVPNVILKDNDLYSKFQIAQPKALRIARQLERDSDFLRSRNIMDYSLLVGVHNKQVQVTWRSLDANYESPDGEWAHLLSINEPTAPDTRETVAAGSSESAVKGSSGDLSSSFTSGGNSLNNSVRGSERMVGRAAWLVENNREPTTQAQDCCIEASSIVGPYAYYFGIIDILQEWTWQKKLERYFKTYFLRKEPAGLSAVEPGDYQDRFMARIGAILNCTDEGDGGSLSDKEESSAADPLLADPSAIVLEPAAIVNSRIRGNTDDGENQFSKHHRHRSSSRSSSATNARASTLSGGRFGSSAGMRSASMSGAGKSGSGCEGGGGDDDDEDELIRTSVSELEAGGRASHVNFVEALRRSSLANQRGGAGQQEQRTLHEKEQRQSQVGGPVGGGLLAPFHELNREEAAQKHGDLEGLSVGSSTRSSSAIRIAADDGKHADFTPAGEAFTDV